MIRAAATPATDTFPLSFHKLLAEFACSPWSCGRVISRRTGYGLSTSNRCSRVLAGRVRTQRSSPTSAPDTCGRYRWVRWVRAREAPDYGFYVAGRRNVLRRGEKAVSEYQDRREAGVSNPGLWMERFAFTTSVCSRISKSLPSTTAGCSRRLATAHGLVLLTTSRLPSMRTSGSG